MGFGFIGTTGLLGLNVWSNKGTFLQVQKSPYTSNFKKSSAVTETYHLLKAARSQVTAPPGKVN